MTSRFTEVGLYILLLPLPTYGPEKQWKKKRNDRLFRTWHEKRRDSFDSISMQRRERGEESKFSRSIKFRNGWYPLKKKKNGGRNIRHGASFDRNGFIRPIFPEVWFRVGLLEKWQIRKFERTNERTGTGDPGNIFPKLVFQLTGKKKKRTMSFDEAWSVSLSLPFSLQS